MICRLTYEKRDEVKYIGHLDTMRTFTRCIKRTNLPVKFSEGFNPRVQLSFALPLGVGVTSECEFVDLELKDDVSIDIDEIKKELNKVLPEGFRITKVDIISKSKSLMSLVREAIYEITIILEDESAENVVNELNDIFSKDELLVEKQSKNKKIEQVNLKGLIIDVKNEVVNYSVVRTTVHCVAGSEKNLNPNLLVEFINNSLWKEMNDYEIHRKKLIIAE